MTATISTKQEASKLSLLTLLPWASLTNWSVHFALENSFSYNPSYSLRPIGSFLLRSRNEIIVQDDTTYQRLTVRWYSQGIVLRDTAKGQDIGTKRQFQVKTGQFVLSRIDARHGAMGMVPPEFNGAIITNDFPAYDLDLTIINPRFFVLITSTAAFMRFCQNCSTGTTNRQRLDEDLFLNVAVPIPPLDEQVRLVAEHDRQMQEAERKRVEAGEARANVKVSFLQSLGLEMPKAPEKKQGWQMVESQHLLDRWDYFAISESETAGIIKAKYPLRPLGFVYNFVSRGWNERKGDTFRYIEIASVEPDLGITGAKKLATQDAPSRASQIVKEGDLIIATTRPYLKKFALAEAEFDDCVCSSGFSVIAASPEYDLLFLREFLFSVYGISQIRDKMTGALYPAITNEALKSIRIPLPSTVAEQQTIIAAVEQQRAAALQSENHAATLEAAAKATFEAAIFA